MVTKDDMSLFFVAISIVFLKILRGMLKRKAEGFYGRGSSRKPVNYSIELATVSDINIR